MAIEQKYGNINVPGIPENEPIFIFRAQDCFVGAVLDFYAKLRASTGDSVGARKVITLRDHFQEYPKKKIPD